MRKAQRAERKGSTSPRQQTFLVLPESKWVTGDSFKAMIIQGQAELIDKGHLSHLIIMVSGIAKFNAGTTA
jgi:hypothetical protein